ncbi:unnamed protein product [Rhodiola kirilowii]
MHQMATALGKLSNLEGFVRQADNLRQQTLHQLAPDIDSQASGTMLFSNWRILRKIESPKLPMGISSSREYDQ